MKPASSFKAFLTIFANNAKRKRTTAFIHSFVACFVTWRFVAKAKAHCAIKERTLTSEDEFLKWKFAWKLPRRTFLINDTKSGTSIKQLPLLWGIEKEKGKTEGTKRGKGEGEKKPPLLSLLSPSVCFPGDFHSHNSQPKGLFTGWLLRPQLFKRWITLCTGLYNWFS